MSTDRTEDTSEVHVASAGAGAAKQASSDAYEPGNDAVRPAGEGRGAATALSTDRAEDTSDVTDAYEPRNDAVRPASEGREVAKA